LSEGIVSEREPKKPFRLDAQQVPVGQGDADVDLEQAVRIEHELGLVGGERRGPTGRSESGLEGRVCEGSGEHDEVCERALPVGVDAAALGHRQCRPQPDPQLAHLEEVGGGGVVVSGGVAALAGVPLTVGAAWSTGVGLGGVLDASAVVVATDRVPRDARIVARDAREVSVVGDLVAVPIRVRSQRAQGREALGGRTPVPLVLLTERADYPVLPVVQRGEAGIDQRTGRLLEAKDLSGVHVVLGRRAGGGHRHVLTDGAEDPRARVVPDGQVPVVVRDRKVAGGDVGARAAGMGLHVHPPVVAARIEAQIGGLVFGHREDGAGAQVAPGRVVREHEQVVADGALTDFEHPASDVEVVRDDDEL
jgi:hypothetical protein